jgi:GT2 family glycosyltransferase
MAPPERDGDSTRGRAQLEWLGWDGRTLRWRVTGQTPVAMQLCIDGYVFQRLPACAGNAECAFDFSPTGNNELEFAMTSVDGAALGAAWRVRFGTAAEHGGDQWTHQPRHLAPLADTPQLPAQARTQLPDIAVIVPIFNAPDSVRRCLAALERWTPANVLRILVDDASTDPAIAPLLARHAAHANVRIERHAGNRGYTTGVNTGIAAAGTADVVLLNSDTEVGPRWLESLRLAAYGDDTFGTVTAVSDNAGAFSVPELEQFCPTPSRWSLVEAQRAVLQQAGLRFPELPTGNGFCMFVKRAVIARIGVMDAAAFPAGYGEENDFCQRAVNAGFRNVIAGNVLVRHERSASFGDARRAALGVQGMAVLRQRYPRYEEEVGATLYSFTRRVLDYRVRRAYAGGDGYYAQRAPRPRLLLARAQDDADALAPTADHEIFVLVRRPALRLYRIAADGGYRHDAEVGGAVGIIMRRAAWLLVHAIEHVVAPSATRLQPPSPNLAGPWEFLPLRAATSGRNPERIDRLAAAARGIAMGARVP